MKTELANNTANEAIHQLQFYKNLYLTHKKINKTLLILFSTLIFRLIVILLYSYLKIE